MRKHGGKDCHDADVSTVQYSSGERRVSVYVTGFEKTLRLGLFMKIEFEIFLISSTIELTISTPTII